MKEYGLHYTVPGRDCSLLSGHQKVDDHDDDDDFLYV